MDMTISRPRAAPGSATHPGTARYLLAGLGVALAALILVGADSVHAQYDRDGRYVPSPLGIPADPYARPIPNYSGKPGDNKGTPIWPRGAMPSPAPLPKMLPRPSTPVHRLPSRLPVAVSAEQCAEGWSQSVGKALGLTRVQFNRSCRRYQKR